MNYDDDMLASDSVYSKLAQEFAQKLESKQPKENNASAETQKQNLQKLYLLLAENEQHLLFFKIHLQRSRYISALTQKNQNLDKALEQTRLLKQKLISLNLVNQATIQTPIRPTGNVKTAYYGCCTNQSEILKLLIWFMLINSVFLPQNDLLEIAYSHSEIMTNLLNLF